MSKSSSYVDKALLQKHFQAKQYTMPYNTYLEKVSENLKEVLSFAKGKTLESELSENGKIVEYSHAEELVLSDKYISAEIQKNFLKNHPEINEDDFKEPQFISRKELFSK